jgi:hypothetical protein
MNVPIIYGVAFTTFAFGFDSGRWLTGMCQDRHAVYQIFWRALPLSVIGIGTFGLLGYGLGRMHTWLEESEQETLDLSLKKVGLIAASAGLMIGSLYHSLYIPQQ